ncbi:MAG: glycosyltransferase family 4 protein [Clostridium sp.]|nr:glycosyltransferase family 4 protein [Clostridium sp.]
MLVSHVSGFIPQFEMNNVRTLQQMGYEVHYATNYNNPSYGTDNSRLDGTGIIRHQIDFVRSPWNILDNVRALRQLTRLMREQNFALVHCHNPMSAALTRVAAKLTDTKPVLYTAHGFHFYKGAPLHMWLIYGLMEWLLSFMTDQQICINKEDFGFAKKHFHCKKVSYIPGVGINIEKIQGNKAADSMSGTAGDTVQSVAAAQNRTDTETAQELRATKRCELGIPEDAIAVVSAGELIPRKNHITMLRAIAGIGDRDDIIYVICGHGELEEELKQQAKALGIEKKVIFAGYRNDLFDIYRACDICAFPSLQEGLPVALLEAMAIGLPVVCSDIRGSNELIDEGRGGFRLPAEDSESFGLAVLHLADDEEARKYMGAYNQKKALEYAEEPVKRKMRRIYRYWLQETQR